MNLLNMSISAGLLILCIAGLRVVALNKLPKTMFLLLWAVALFRLLVPLWIPGPFPSPFQAMTPPLSPGSAPLSLTESSVLPESGLQIAGIPAAPAAQIPEASITQSFPLTPWVLAWLIGMFLTLLFLAAVYLNMHRKLRSATPMENSAFLNQWRANHKLLRPIAILRSDNITTPLAVGIFRPRIILPAGLNFSDEARLSYILAHEYCHIKRLDTLWKCLFAIALCVHWFNPLVWLMFFLANRDLELSCDQWVLRRFGPEKRAAYARTLIGMAEHGRGFTLLHSSFQGPAAEERITSIMKSKKSSILGTAAAVVLVATLLIATLAAPGSEAKSTAPYVPEAQNFVADTVRHTSQAPDFTLEMNVPTRARDNYKWVRLPDSYPFYIDRELGGTVKEMWLLRSYMIPDAPANGLVLRELDTQSLSGADFKAHILSWYEISSLEELPLGSNWELDWVLEAIEQIGAEELFFDLVTYIFDNDLTGETHAIPIKVLSDSWRTPIVSFLSEREG